MKRYLFALVALIGLTACTSEDIKKTAYETAASYQCYQDFKANPDGDRASANCPPEKSLDGKTYEEYKKDKRKPE